MWGVDWLLWRLVASSHIPDGLRDVQQWSVKEIVQGHAVLDTIETVLEHQRRPKGG